MGKACLFSSSAIENLINPYENLIKTLYKPYNFQNDGSCCALTLRIGPLLAISCGIFILC